MQCVEVANGQPFADARAFETKLSALALKQVEQFAVDAAVVAAVTRLAAFVAACVLIFAVAYPAPLQP